jgi:hypothetical protein
MKSIFLISLIALFFSQDGEERKFVLDSQDMIALLNYNLEPEYAKGNQVFLMDSFQLERSRKLIRNYAKVHLGFCDQIELDSFDFQKLKENFMFNKEIETLIIQNSNLRLVNSSENQIDTLKLTLISRPVIIDYGELKIGSVIKKRYFVKEVNQLKWFHADYVLNMSVFISNKWDCKISIDLN